MEFINVQSVLTTLFIAILTAFFAYVKSKIGKIGKRLSAQDKATVAMLRMDLRQVARGFIKDGYTDYDSLEDWDDMYEQYHALGGNGTMETVRSKIHNLPIKGD